MFSPAWPAAADFAYDFYHGSPLPTWFSTRPELRSTYAATRHLIEAGRWFTTYGDFEATDKDRNTATPRDGGFLTFDLMGRLTARFAAQSAIPPHYIYAIGAALVGNQWPDDLAKGLPPFIFMAMVRDYFSAAARIDGLALGLPPASFKDGKEGYLYSFDFPDHPPLTYEVTKDGKKFRAPGEQDWRKLYGDWRPFNGERYDNFLMANAFAGQGGAHMFVASRRKHDFVCEDVRGEIMWLHAFGPQGDAGMVLLPRLHKATGRTVLSTRLGDSVQMHAPATNGRRGVGDGVIFHDGRQFDPLRAHGSPEDAAATAALDFYLRRRWPDELRGLDEAVTNQKARLQGELDFANRPLVGFMHYSQGLLSRKIGMMAGTGDRYKTRSQNEIAFLNLTDYAPADIFTLSEGERRALLTDRDRPLLTIHRDYQTPIDAPFERAYRAGTGAALTPEVYQRRRNQWLDRRDELQNIMDLSHELRHPARPPDLQTPRRLDADSFSHYQSADAVLLIDPVTGNRLDEPSDIKDRRRLVLDKARRIDEALNKITEGHALDYSDDPRAAAAWVTKYKSACDDIAKRTRHDTAKLVLPPVPATGDLDTLRLFLWRLRAELRDARFAYRPLCWVVNEEGQCLPWDKVIALPYAARNALWPRGDIGEDRVTGPHLRFQFLRDSKRYPAISAFVAADAERYFSRYGNTPAGWRNFYQEIWDQSRPWLTAQAVFAVQGPPRLEPAKHSFMTARQAEVEAQAMAVDLPAQPDGLLATIIRDRPEAARAQLAAWQDYYAARLAQESWTPAHLAQMGFAANGQPRARVGYRVAADAPRLIVPDAMLDEPQSHRQWPEPFLVLNQPERGLQRALTRLAGTRGGVLLEGSETGMVRYAAVARCQELPATVDGIDAHRVAQALHAAAGMKLGARVIRLTFERLVPVEQGAGAKRQTLRAVPLSALDWAGLVSPAAALGRDGAPLTAFLLRDVGQRPFQPGALRLRRRLAGTETGDEFRGELAAAEIITLDAVRDFGAAALAACGRPNAADLCSFWAKEFAQYGVHRPAEQRLHHLRLTRPVVRASYHFTSDALPTAIYASGPQ